MLVKEIMSTNALYLAPTSTLAEAATKMKEKDFGFIPIGENDRLIGAVTDRDITITAVAAGKDPKSTKLRDVMSKGIQYCFEKDDIKKAAKKMEQLRIRRLVVLDENKRLTGVVSFGDIARSGKDTTLSGEIAEEVSSD